MFNALLEDIVRHAKAAWPPKAGLHLDCTAHRCLTNLRFADDVFLFAYTLPKLQQMLTVFKDTTQPCGLLLHPEKTKILTTVTGKTGRPRRTHVDIGDMSVEIIPLADSIKYLGRLISFHRPHDAELDNRIRLAWKSFMS